MQTFAATLNKAIDIPKFLQAWKEQSPTPPNPRVDFKFNGQSLEAKVHSGQYTPWEKNSFCTALKMVAHKIDAKCEITTCTLFAWQVVGDGKPSVRYYEESAAQAARGPNDVVIRSDE